MNTFPTLNTGAVMQYPAERVTGFSTTVVRFTNGEEQRFPGYPTALRRWAVRLDLLDEDEAAALERLFLEQDGAFGTFTFTDPWDGRTYPGCTLESNEWIGTVEREHKSSTTLTVRENRA